LPSKYHELLVNDHTRGLGFLCRVIIFLEDVSEDSGCGDVPVDERGLVEGVLVFRAVGCSGDVCESAEVFAKTTA
jgi:hypothetical protein